MIVGDSPVLNCQLTLLKEFAVSDAPVYIYGETGTGKELVARTIHGLSTRADKRFVAQNCAAIPDTLLQSLLFGHRRGSFTGADRDQVGLFEAAHGGTLLLDEISDMSPTVQGALVRVLQEKELTRLGDVDARKVDVRVISASNKRLEEQIEAGRFRKDLFFRLVTLRIDLPTLQERRSDVPLLIDHFVREYNAHAGKGITGIEAVARTVMESYPWPGNVRQLEAEVHRACILTPAGGQITMAALSPHLRGGTSGSVTAPDYGSIALDGRSLPSILRDVERALLMTALQRANGNKAHAARMLGVSRQRFAQRLRRWHL